jgi:hypothetical protein
MNQSINIEEIINLVKKQHPDREDISEALKNCKGGFWGSKAYYQFIDSTHANKEGATWQFAENLILEDRKSGTIILDILTHNRIGGIEFLKKI